MIYIESEKRAGNKSERTEKLKEKERGRKGRIELIEIESEKKECGIETCVLIKKRNREKKGREEAWYIERVKIDRGNRNKHTEREKEGKREKKTKLRNAPDITRG